LRLQKRRRRRRRRSLRVLTSLGPVGGFPLVSWGTFSSRRKHLIDQDLAVAYTSNMALQGEQSLARAVTRLLSRWLRLTVQDCANTTFKTTHHHHQYARPVREHCGDDNMLQQQQRYKAKIQRPHPRRLHSNLHLMPPLLPRYALPIK